MVEAFSDPAGTHVNYKAMRQSHQLRAYCKVAAELQCTDVSAVAGGGPCAKAFFLNLYNAMVCHGLCAFGRSPTLAMTCFFDRVQYRVGPWRLSLNDIEHGVLRCNRPRPSSMSAPFGACDARRCLSFRSVDPRIHFALNCGARSCPAIRIYCPFTVDRALDAAVAAFVAVPQNLAVNASTAEVRLSKLFSWYRQDFAGESPAELIRWLLPHMPPSRQQAAMALLGDHGEDDCVAKGGFELLPVITDGKTSVTGGAMGDTDLTAVTGTLPSSQRHAVELGSHASEDTSWASAPRSLSRTSHLEDTAAHVGGDPGRESANRTLSAATGQQPQPASTTPSMPVIRSVCEGGKCRLISGRVLDSRLSLASAASEEPSASSSSSATPHAGNPTSTRSEGRGQSGPSERWADAVRRPASGGGKRADDKAEPATGGGVQGWFTGLFAGSGGGAEAHCKPSVTPPRVSIQWAPYDWRVNGEI